MKGYWISFKPSIQLLTAHAEVTIDLIFRHVWKLDSRIRIPAWLSFLTLLFDWLVEQMGETMKDIRISVLKSIRLIFHITSPLTW